MSQTDEHAEKPIGTVGADGMLRVTCGACGYRVKAPTSMAGQSGRCPKCKGEVFMPWVDPVVNEDEIFENEGSFDTDMISRDTIMAAKRDHAPDGPYVPHSVRRKQEVGTISGLLRRLTGD